MEAYIRQKRASPGMVQASDLQINRPMSGLRTSASREMHAYDGPMQFISSPQNPDQILSNTTTAMTTTPTTISTTTPITNNGSGKFVQNNSHLSRTTPKRGNTLNEEGKVDFFFFNF